MASISLGMLAEVENVGIDVQNNGGFFLDKQAIFIANLELSDDEMVKY
jgi:hypothetical protein